MGLSKTVGVSCPNCTDALPLVSESGWAHRLNSRIAQAKCTSCNKQFVLKQLIEGENESHPGQEYQTLECVFQHFPNHPEFRVAKPLAYISDQQIIVMGFESGDAFLSVLKMADVKVQADLLRRAGRWLATLHHCRRATAHDMGAASRLSGLSAYMREGARGTDTLVRQALALLSDLAPGLNDQSDSSVWIHGDFTPDNLLADRDVLIGLDISWTSQANPVLDIAPFLNHLSLQLTPFPNWSSSSQIGLLEDAFIRGYFEEISTQQRILLNWYRLYFFLSYRRSAQDKGMLRYAIAKKQIDPKIMTLSKNLADLTQ